jgi:hypothetical protein
MELVGKIQEKDINKLKSSAQSVPVQRCQRWTCDLLEDLGRNRLITAGWTTHFRGRIEPSPYEESNEESTSDVYGLLRRTLENDHIRATEGELRCFPVIKSAVEKI